MIGDIAWVTKAAQEKPLQWTGALPRAQGDGEAFIYAVTDDLSLKVHVGSLPTKASSTCNIVGAHLSCIFSVVIIIVTSYCTLISYQAFTSVTSVPYQNLKSVKKK